MRLAQCLLLFLLAAWPSTPKAQSFAITHVRVVDVENGAISRPRTILVSDGRIVAVGPSRKTRIPGDAVEIDGTGRFVVPGLWDMGSYLLNGTRGVPGGPELMVAHGVVGTRDLGTAGTPVQIRSLIDEIRSGRRTGPKVIWTTHMLSRSLDAGVGRAGPSFADIRSEAEAVSAIDAIADAGAHYVRVVQNFPEAWLPTVVQASRARHLPVFGAVVSSWRGAAAAGLVGFDHFPDLYRSTARRPERDQFLQLYRDPELRRRYNSQDRMYAFLLPLRSLRDRRYYRLQIAALVQAGTPVTTNMATMFWAQAANADLIGARARYAYVGRSQEIASPGTTEAEARDGLFADLRDLRDAGVPIMAGTQADDSGHELPGATLQDELIWLVRAGFSARQALAAATVTPADVIARLFPRIEAARAVRAGQPADLVMLDANPLIDISNIRRIHGVMANGRWYGPAERQLLLERAASLAAMTPG